MNSPPTAVDDAFAAVSPGEKVILAGIPGDDRTSFSASIGRDRVGFERPGRCAFARHAALSA